MILLQKIKQNVKMYALSLTNTTTSIKYKDSL